MRVTTQRAFVASEFPGPSVTAKPGRLRRHLSADHPGLLLGALLASLIVAAPLLYLAVRAGEGGLETWQWLLSERLPGLMARTFALTAGTTLLAVAFALPLAWLVHRTDLPGRRWLTWIGALPLVFPPYVGAFVYITLVGPALYSLPGAMFILALFTYPYIYLLAGSALRGSNQSLEDAARSAGLSQGQVFWRVTLPLLRPALVAGALLVILYALSDFGSVAMLRVETFTAAIYLQIRGRFDRSAAAVLSLVLVLLTVGILLFEEAMKRQGARYYQTTGHWRPIRPVALGRWRWAATLFAWGVAFASVGLPLGMLLAWSVEGLAERGLSAKMLSYASNSLIGAGGAATLASLLAFPVAYLAARHRSALSQALFRLAYVGYSLPGIVVALAATFLFHRFLGPLYGTVWALLTAYVIRFLPQSMGALHSGLGALSPNLEDAGRSLGLTSGQVLRKITLPLIAPSLVTGWALVFLNVLKELPATLLMRPAGFDTLAVRVWIDADE
ncbi:MAG: ABC transporter permease, partial [Bacillota bacterium]